MVDWFHSLFGFSENNYQQTQTNFEISKDCQGSLLLTSKVNHKSYQVGQFSTPNLEYLIETVNQLSKNKDILQGDIVYERKIIGDIFNHHVRSPGALFQAASQFNCLEFVNPHQIPENGIYRYQNDHTQGPACALATVPGTIYRNYFVLVNSHQGQNKQYQLNNLDSVQHYLKSKFGDSFITVTNGYSESTPNQLKRLNKLLETDKSLSIEIKKRLKFGFHQHTQVVFKSRWKQVSSKKTSLVSQIYCSALAINYSKVKDKKLWEPLSRIILDASYEATLLAGIINFSETGNPNIFLTQLGGGVFGNKTSWIEESIQKALTLVQRYQIPIHVINCFYNSVSIKDSRLNRFIYSKPSSTKKKKKYLLSKKKSLSQPSNKN